MIDIESDVFTSVAAVLTNAYDGIYVTDDYINKPASFPAVMIFELDNTVRNDRRDTDGTERAAEVTYQVDVFSTRVKGRKAEARAIAATIDNWFASKGFSRFYFSPTPNQYSAQIYRITLRFRAIVDESHTIYRR